MENTENVEETTEKVKADKADSGEQVAEATVEEVKTEEKEDYKEKYFYLAAEMQNMQRRFDKEKENLLKYGSEKILKDILDVIDNLDRTLGFIREDEDEKVKNIVVGIEMIQKLFLETLSKHGLQTIEALGKEFDPNLHEALAQQPAEDKENNEVILVHQNGYSLNDRVIRAAKVVIAKND